MPLLHRTRPLLALFPLLALGTAGPARAQRECNQNCPPAQRDPDGCCPGSRPRPPLPETGSLYVTAGTVRAQVLLDGREVGTTPLRLDGIAPGTHIVEVHANGHAGPPRRVNLHRGELVTISAPFSTPPTTPRQPHTPSPAQILARHEDRCDDGNLTACVDAGTMHQHGTGGLPRNPARAAEFYRRACDGGNMGGCTMLGALYASGQGVALDVRRAVQLHSQACTGGSLAGCVALGAMYEQGTGVRRDLARAVSLYRQACEGGNPRGCQSLQRLPH